MMAGARCPRCGAGIGTGSSFCPYCGAQLGQAMGQPAGPMGQPMAQSTGSNYATAGVPGRLVPQFSGNSYIVDQTILAIRDMSGQPIAQIHKKWVSVRDSYCVEILNTSMDPYMIISYAISLDHTEKKEKH